MSTKNTKKKPDLTVEYGVRGSADVKGRSACPVSCALDVLGDKWTLLIIRDMMIHHKNTYTEFLNSDEKIATNILADRLNILEKSGIITKQTHPDKKSKYLYRLTRKGIDLLPVLAAIAKWSSTYGTYPDEIRAFIGRIEENLEGITAELSEELV